MRSPLRARPGAPAPTRPPQPRPPTGLRRDPHAQPSPAQLQLASQAPGTETQPATATAVRGTTAYSAAAAAILAHPAPVAAAADVSDGYVSARHAPESPRLSPSPSLWRPHPLAPPPMSCPLGIAPNWFVSASISPRPFLTRSRLVQFFAPSSFCPAPWPRLFFSAPFRHAPLDSAPRSCPVFRSLVPSPHPHRSRPLASVLYSYTLWPRPSPTCPARSAGPASRRRPGYAGSVLQASCFRI